MNIDQKLILNMMLQKSWEVCTISLWYYHQGYRKSSSIGTLYSGTINELEEEVKVTLEELLHSEDN